MTSSRTWIAVAAVVCLVVVGLYAYRARHSQSRGDAPRLLGGAASPGATAAAGDPANPAATPSGTSSAPFSAAASASGTAAIGRPQSGPGAMPYRPATPLRYSDAPPAPSASGDAGSPVVARILDAAQPDAGQKQQIMDLWHEHEEARRALYAALPPKNSAGPPMPDRQKLNAVDLKFAQSLLYNVLRPDQRERVVLQTGPSGR